MSPDQRQIDAAIEGASQVAQGCFGAGATIRAATVISTRARSVVLRCELTPQPALPGTVIAKLQSSDDARGFSDWASLAFLTAVDDERAIAPHFYGGDTALRLFLMEDLGTSHTIADLMAAGNAATLRRALQALAEPMARLVAATAEPALEAHYERLRGNLPGGETANRHAEAQRWREAWPRVSSWFAALDCPLGDGIEAAIEHVAAVYDEPGPLLAFSHGDPAPTNNHIGPGTTRLLDFEYGAYRHALYDLTGWYVLCPLPEAWAAELQASFRAHLATTWPPLADAANYQTGWAAMCAYRALAIVSWLPLDILDADLPWAEGWTMRGALLTAATRLRRATAGTPELATLGEASIRLAQAARARWPELGTGLPSWPVDADSHADRAE